MDERAKTDHFEGLDVPDGFKAELLRGDIVMMAEPDRVHNQIILEVRYQSPRYWLPPQTQDIAVPGETSEPRPDLVVVERGAVEGRGRLVPAPACGLLMEVVSRNSAERDHRSDAPCTPPVRCPPT